MDGYYCGSVLNQDFHLELKRDYDPNKGPEENEEEERADYIDALLAERTKRDKNRR